jgi:hypothetical protein
MKLQFCYLSRKAWIRQLEEEMTYQISALILEILFNYTTLYFLFLKKYEQAIVWNIKTIANINY